MLPTKMFGMGMTEILVILLVAALFLGPEKLPEAATKISKGIRDLRRQQRDLQDTIENDTQIGGAIRDLKSALRGDEIRRPPVLKKPAKAEAVAAAAALAGTDAAALPEATGAPDAPPAASTEHDLVTDPPTEAAPAAAGAQLATTTSPAVEAQAEAEATSSTPAALSVPARLTLAPTAGDPDRDHAPDDDDDEQAELARLVRPAPGAVKRDDHGST